MVVEGTADVDESMITGESRAVAKEPGDTVVAGTVAAGGCLASGSTAMGDATALSGIMRLVAAAQASASRAQALADRAAAILFYVALGAGTSPSCSGGCRAIPRVRSSGRRPCWSSPARMRSGSPSRW